MEGEYQLLLIRGQSEGITFIEQVKGSYGYKDAWGIYRHVDYIADKYGFRAHIKTNEPGTAPKDPAAVKMSSHPVPAGHGHPKKHHHHAG